jgi:hypothetical protein
VVKRRRLAVLGQAPPTAPHAGGVLVMDETGDRQWDTKTAHVGRQDLDSLGTIANGVYPEQTPITGSTRGVHPVLQGVRQINVYPLLHGVGAPLRLGPMSTPAVGFASLRTQRTIGQKPVWYP